MRQRSVWIRRVQAYRWTEIHTGTVESSVQRDYDEWDEPLKRFHGSPFMRESTQDTLRNNVTREVNRDLYGFYFILRPLGTWDMFERMARAEHCEWRDDECGPYLTSAAEKALLQRGSEIFSPWYEKGHPLSWEWRAGLDLKKHGMPRWIQSVVASRWWSDRMGVGNLLVLPPKNGLPSFGVRSPSKGFIEKAKWSFTLEGGRETPVGVALELLRERDKKDSPVSTRRFLAFAERFWGEERAKELTRGTF